jgi:putative glutamine amidotransferase
VGVYFEDQKYDFRQTRDYIVENNSKNFFLHVVRGELNEGNLFEENDCTDDIRTIFENSAGVFFFGGPDIPPGVYGEENTLSVVTDPERHYFETTFLFHLLGGFWNENFEALLHKKPNYLVTGFCLGMQTMNVATGGTLIQDIPAEIFGAETPEAILKTGRANLHRNYWQEISDDTLLMGINLHTIKFSNHPFFGEVVKVSKRWEPRIYSSHHQAAEKLGKGMEITALSPDGKIVEGLAHTEFPNVFAVQFHPEVPGLYEDLYIRKFHPEDQPMSYNDIIGKQSVKFHKRYWEHISEVIRRAKK